jgi:hypothetical protein
VRQVQPRCWLPARTHALHPLCSGWVAAVPGRLTCRVSWSQHQTQSCPSVAAVDVGTQQAQEPWVAGLGL